MSDLNPRTTHFEFSGPKGAFSILTGLPLLCITLFFVCNVNGCPASLTSIKYQLLHTTWLSRMAVKVYIAWVGGLMALDVLLPGEIVNGTRLRNGRMLKYKFNGTNIIALLFSTLAFRAWYTGLALPELQFIYDHLLELLNASLLFAFSFSTYLYLVSFSKDKQGVPKLLALGGNSGNAIYDWFIGRELNPRWGPVDLKLFLEMRPGLLLWILIDLSMLHHQYLKYGHTTWSLVLVTLFQTYYVVEGTFYEKGLVSMIDTTTDGLGFMLVFGDVSLVPFTYSLQARYLADHAVVLSWPAIVGIVGIYIGGILIFRLSNNEKNGFKSGDPAYAHLKYLETPTGSKLLITGWWGQARHINYLGDWVSSWAYSLPCGLTPVPYYYVIYFAALLIHRNERDEAKCSAKYGETWEEYKRRVPYKFVPHLF